MKSQHDHELCEACGEEERYAPLSPKAIRELALELVEEFSEFAEFEPVKTEFGQVYEVRGTLDLEGLVRFVEEEVAW